MAQAQLEFPGLTVESRLSAAPPDAGLARLSAEVDLLVLGCRRTEDSRLPKLGPVTSWLIDHAECPVAVAHEPVEPTAAAGATARSSDLSAASS